MNVHPSSRVLRKGLLRILLSSCAIATEFSVRGGLDNSFHSPTFTQPAEARKVLVLPGDSFLAFHSFTRLSGAAVGPIVKFNANGSRDQAFRFPDGYFSITAAAPTSDGHLIVAAAQQDKAGRNFNRILKLNSNGSIDGSVNSGSGANDEVGAVALQTDNKILVGGLFTRFNQTARPGFLRLNANGSIDATFAPLSLASTEEPSFVGVLAPILIQSDGKSVIGGSFTSINGVSAQGVARLNLGGTVDTSFTASTSYNTRVVRDIALDADERILIPGGFVNLDDPGYWPLARLNTDGTLDRYFQPSTLTSRTRTVEILPNQEILFAEFYLFRNDSDGNLLPGYPQTPFSNTDPDKLTPARDIDAQSSGSFLVAGPDLANGLKRGGLARFQPNGTLDSFYAGDFQAELLPEKAATAADGKIYVSGKFHYVDGIARSGFARLQSNGIVDAGYDLANTLNLYKTSGFVLHPDGKLLVFGWENDSNRGPVFLAHRITASGQIDSSFDGSFYDYSFSDAALAPDGSYLAWEPYSTLPIYNDTVLVRINADGSTDNDFCECLPRDHLVYEDNPDPDLLEVYAGETKPLAFLAEGKFLAKYFDKTENYHLVRANKDGSIDPSFHRGSVRALDVSKQIVFPIPSPFDADSPPITVAIALGSALSDVALLSDGKIIVVGKFTKYNDAPAPGIVRLLSNGQIDGTFKPGGGAQWTVTQVDATHVPQIDSIELQPNGQLLIAGNFEAYNGVPAPGIALLHSDGKPDTTFVPPVTLQNFGPFAQFPAGKLYRAKAGSYLLTGRYAKTGETTARSLVRIETPVPAQALNISARIRVATGANVLIGGFIITGNEQKKVIVRAIGPSLTNAGLSGVLANPVLELYSGSSLLARNDNWKSTQAAAIVASRVPPKNDLESAIVRTLDPGAYTAIVRGANSGTGIGLVEVYDLDPTANSKFANISARGFVETADNVMIAGFITGQGTISGKILVRAIGPSLTAFGVPNALANPTLTLHNGNGVVIASNDNWKTTQQSELQATGAPPKNDLEAAIVRTLGPGAYTAIVRGKSNSSGVALVEVYALD